jgi:hypothetical protein
MMEVRVLEIQPIRLSSSILQSYVVRLVSAGRIKDVALQRPKERNALALENG